MIDIADINDAYESRADSIKNLKRDEFAKTLPEKKLDHQIGESMVRVTAKEEDGTERTNYFYCLPAGAVPAKHTK
jgi:hypothetical protein